MAFVSFVGRLIFVSAFKLSAWQEYNEFGVDGRSAACILRPKFDVFSQHVSSHTGFNLPAVELLHQAIATPILYDFYNYDPDRKQFSQLFTKFTQLVGALLFFIGMNNKIIRRQIRTKTTKPKTM